MVTSPQAVRAWRVMGSVAIEARDAGDAPDEGRP
jgi:hypothetical protein